MLALSFFSIVFSTILWLVYSFVYISENAAGISMSSLGLVNLAIYIALVCVPILIMWMIFGFINQFVHNKNTSISFGRLFQQMKKNQDYSDLIARALIESGQHVKDGFVLSRFDLLIADMNELLSEIVYGCNIASVEQIERLWNKVQNGGKWAFGKVIIEVNQNQPNFQIRVFEKARLDTVLAGTIMEFCARYLGIISLLDKHDREKTFLNVLETGIFGKVFSIFAPISDEIRRNRESAVAFKSKPVLHEEPVERPLKTQAPVLKAQIEPSYHPEPIAPKREDNKSSLIEKFSIFKKKEHSTPSREPSLSADRDPFSMALERSFGSNESEETPLFASTPFDEEGPRFEISREEEPKFETEPRVMDEPRFETPRIEENPFQAVMNASQEDISNTQRALDAIKKDWEEKTPIIKPISANAEPELNRKAEENDDNLAYPFGGWTDENKYSR